MCCIQVNSGMLSMLKTVHIKILSPKLVRNLHFMLKKHASLLFNVVGVDFYCCLYLRGLRLFLMSWLDSYFNLMDGCRVSLWYAQYAKLLVPCLKITIFYSSLKVFLFLENRMGCFGLCGCNFCRTTATFYWIPFKKRAVTSALCIWSEEKPFLCSRQTSLEYSVDTSSKFKPPVLTEIPRAFKQ